MAIERVAVIGSGVMGAGIAAQCANAGLSVMLLDIVIARADDRCSLSKDAVQRQLKSGGFMSPEFAERIDVGNLEDDLDKLSDADWIVEVVVEDLAIKRELYERIDPMRKPGAVVSSNTSTLRLQQLSEGMSEGFRRHFMITHFFNPPRHMRLLELVGSPETDTEALEQVFECCDKTLGKGVVHCKDTPGFIANRIGVYWLMAAVH
ncbi:MAG: 3-hydroxyacyl-CoA dehydrogenase family protein, partial [Gammaproteobacteria bacterium]